MTETQFEIDVQDQAAGMINAINRALEAYSDTVPDGIGAASILGALAMVAGDIISQAPEPDIARNAYENFERILLARAGLETNA